MMYLLECKAPQAGGDAAKLAAQLLPPHSDPAGRAAVLSWFFWQHVSSVTGAWNYVALPPCCQTPTPH